MRARNRFLEEERLVWGEVQSCIHQFQNREALFVPVVTPLTFLGLSHSPMMCRGPQKTAKHFSSMFSVHKKEFSFLYKGQL